MEKALILEDELETQTSHTSPPNQPSLKTQVSQLRMILEVSRSLNSTLDLDRLLHLIIQVAGQVTSTEAASILLLDEKTGELHFEATTGAKRAELKAVRVPLEGSIAGWIVSHNQSLVVNNARHDPRHYGRADQATRFDTRSILGVPLRVKNKTIGVLEVLNKCGDSPFTRQDLETLETLAAQAAIAIENARLYKDLQDQMQALQEAQAQLVQREKLAAVGELVAGVAHELNNPLTSIIGFASLLQCKNLDEQSRNDVGKILVQARRAAGIVHGLLDFARQRPPEKRLVQINGVLISTLDLLAYELRTHNIECTLDLAPDLPLTTADPYQLQQVFVNLINNARQAMSGVNGGGHLAITTQFGPSVFTKQQNMTEPVIRVIVRDDGPGIPHDLLSSIFDPFFTTKPVGQGTGLGLSVCHGIVSEHGGRIWAESEPGQGAAFFVELPLILQEAVHALSKLKGPYRLKPGRAPSKAYGKAHILIIDDETDLLSILMRALKAEGYRVDAVSNGKAALAHLAKTDYDLIVCDIRMPGLSGPELYRLALEREPGLAQRFVFTTGDSVGLATRYFLDEIGAPYMCKPFGPAELIAKLQELLAEKPGKVLGTPR